VFVAQRHDPRSLPPHAYQVTCNAYEQMLAGKRNQSMVISGESGAGKTEATKICLSFLAKIAGTEGVGSPSQLLLDSSPIMESFGNAKTVRNNNSSRFGKYMDLYFGANRKIVNGNIKKYLLEKSRIVFQQNGERNYHVFFQIFHLPADWRAQMKLTAPDDYHFLKQGGCSTVEGIDDPEELGLMRDAFKRLGISDSDAIAMFSIVAAVMHLGNARFERSGDETVQVANPDDVALASNLLGVDAKACEKTLVTREIKAGREIAIANNNHKQAEDSRDGLAKALYGKLFDYITDLINKGIAAVKTGELVNSIGVLDIFGFEIFKVNSFEQLCINLANEKLQYHFNAHIFLLELDIYKREKLNVSEITFRDNQGCLDLIEQKKTGILAMIEEEIYVPRGSDDTLLEKLHTKWTKSSDFYERPKMKGGRGKSSEPRDCFVVKHFAGLVSYSVSGFLEKCKDRLPPDAEAMVKASSNPLVEELFREDVSAVVTPRRGGRVPTLGGQFKESLGQLYETLMATEPHFIKCVKPNNVKKCVFDSDFTLYQLTYLGLLEVIRIRKSGYPVRMLDKEFKGRYKLLMPGTDARAITSKMLCENHGQAGEWQIGSTMVFMRDGMYKDMESQRAQQMDKNVRALQRWIREELTRKAWTKCRGSYIDLQAAYRGAVGRRVAGRRRAEVGVEKMCQKAMKLRKEELCVEALAKADEIDYHPRMVDDVRYIIDRIRDEREVEDMLRTAIHRKVLEDVEEALKAVDAIELAKAWSSLPKTDERAGLIPRCKLVYDQLTKYGDLMKQLSDAMQVRSVERLTAAIKEAERLQMGTPDNPCPEVEEAKAMIKMAEFEKASKQERRVRKEKREKKSGADISEGTPPSPEVMQSRRNLEVASVSPMLRAAVTAASAEKLNKAISQASSRLDDEAAQESQELALAKLMLQEINASSGDSDSIARRLGLAMDSVSSDSLDVKQRELGIALALATNSGTAVSPEATQAWREISEASTIQSMLEQAASSGRRRLLDIAVVRAQKSSAFTAQAGSAGQELLRTATRKLELLQKEFQAKRRLDEASTAADPGQMEDAIAHAESMGIGDSKEATDARILLGRIKAGESPVKSDLAPDTMPDTARRRMYRMTRLAGLRNRMVPLYCGKEPLTAPLLESGKADEGTFTELALQAARSTVQFMWPAAEGAGTETALKSVLQMGVDRPELRDEIYVQVIRQGTRNDDSVSMLRWSQLLLQTVHSFAPTAKAHPYAVVWLEEQLDPAAGGRHSSKVKGALQQTLKLLQTTSVPTRSAAAMPAADTLTELCQELSSGASDVAVYLLDGSAQHFTASTTLEAAVDKLTEMFHLTSGGGKYGLFQVPSSGAMTTEARLLTSSPDAAERTLGEQVAQWNAPPADGTLASKMSPRGRATYRICFMRRLFFTDMVHNSTRGDIDLLYMHARRRISEGVFSCDEEDVHTLAGLAIQAELGDYNELTTPQLLKVKLGEYIPNQAKKLHKPKYVHSDSPSDSLTHVLCWCCQLCAYLLISLPPVAACAGC
jgi:myosin heavy subunit